MKVFFSTLSCLFISLSLNAHPYQRLIVFGDSLSDGGTYAGVAGPKGGGQFTINPYGNWIDSLGLRLGLPISANRTEGFGQPLKILGGLNYAQGGARVALNPGIGVDNGYTARSLADQVNLYLSEQKHFSNNDLVIVEGGANDILIYAAQVLKGQTTLASALNGIDSISSQLAQLVLSIKQSGNPFIVVTTMSDLSKTPRAIGLGPDAIKIFAALTQKFNSGVLQKIKGLDQNAQLQGLKIQIVRFDLFDQKVMKYQKHFGLKNLTQPACPKETLPGNTALFCQTALLVSPEALTTYKFADELHPTPKVYEIFADMTKEAIAPNHND